MSKSISTVLLAVLTIAGAASAAPAVPSPPTISKAFGASAITVGQQTTLTFTLGNPTGNSSTLDNISFTDTLPAGLAGVSLGEITCVGGYDVEINGDVISVSAVTLAAGDTCTVVIGIKAIGAGEQNNVTSTVTSTESAAGLTASASILVLPRDAAQIGYSANLSAGDSFVNLTNTGSVNGFDPAGDICANVYVFAEDQQLIACCTCPLTPDHLKTLSAQNDLINNTLTPGVPIGITTLLVASTGACNAASPGPLAPGLKAWGTTLHALPGGGYGVTETPFLDVTPSASELTKLATYCGFIQADGTTYGICGSCVAGAAGAKKQ